MAARYLRGEGCDAIQGFVVEKALGESDAAAFINAFDSARFVSAIEDRHV